MLKNPLFSKILMLFALSILLLIPLGMIQSKISERQSLQHQVKQDIARSASGQQTLQGPQLIVKYKVRERYTTKDKDGNERTTISESSVREAMFSPQNLKISGKTDVETRHRGIYKANLYTLKADLSGQFSIPRGYGINRAIADIIPVSAYFVMNVSDARGIRNVPVLSLNGKALDFLPGMVQPAEGNGMHVRLNTLSAEENHKFDFSFPLELQGMDTLAISPVGDHTELNIHSAWPHPSFGGSYLPQKHTISDKGFEAYWQVSNLARNSAGSSQTGDAFSVSFIDPVNIYLLSERAVKYGILFVVLIFTAFFIFEILRKWRIHPMQYLLVGMALAIFFLLLISLSEHIAFLAAYSLSGLACVALIAAYLLGVLRHKKTAFSFSSGIGLLYAVLYGVLQSEDNALLMGAMILFGALTAVMLLTRNMNWYELGKAETAG